MLNIGRIWYTQSWTYWSRNRFGKCVLCYFLWFRYIRMPTNSWSCVRINSWRQTCSLCTSGPIGWRQPCFQNGKFRIYREIISYETQFKDLEQLFRFDTAFYLTTLENQPAVIAEQTEVQEYFVFTLCLSNQSTIFHRQTFGFSHSGHHQCSCYVCTTSTKSICRHRNSTSCVASAMSVTSMHCNGSPAIDRDWARDLHFRWAIKPVTEP